MIKFSSLDLSRRICTTAVVLLSVLSSSVIALQEKGATRPTPNPSISGGLPTVPSVSTTANLPPDGILPIDRAWESKHYRVRVWICTDGSPVLQDILPTVKTDVGRLSMIVDASGWEVFVETAPHPWFWRCFRDFHNPNQLVKFETLSELKFDDKLMIVRLVDLGHGIDCQIREYDLTTGQMGPIQIRQSSQLNNIGQLVTDSIHAAFMPLARIEEVSLDGSVVIRSRGINSCVQVHMDEQLNWIVSSNLGSPVLIKPDDKFLPILRKTNRSDLLESLEPIPFTFLTIDRIEGTLVFGQVQSAVRAPLSGRTSKRLQKLALVIRPPARPTSLKVVASDNPKLVLEGVEVFARRPQDKQGDASEFLGKTDWNGIVVVPPGTEGLRLIYLKRGARAIKKLPIMPGFHDSLTTEVVNDEARLFAEGVILGIQSEILDLVVQRLVFESRIAEMLEKNMVARARSTLEKYQELPSNQKLISSLSDEETRLTTQAKTRKEQDYIKNMFLNINRVLNGKIAETREVEIRQKIQSASAAAIETPSK